MGRSVAMPLLTVRGVSKSFPGTRALSDVSLAVRSGEVVALVGHNGSGKSTLIKILSGFYVADPGGEVIRHSVGGREAELHFIHQDLGLVGMLSTVENLDIGRSLGRAGWLPARKRREGRHAEALVRRFGASIDVYRPVDELSAAERAIVAIARALDGWSDERGILVLDEPTVSLGRDEVDQVLDVVGQVAKRGAGVVFVSHHLEEVRRVADRVVVLRDGLIAAEMTRGEFTHDDLVGFIAGEVNNAQLQEHRAHLGEVALAVRDLANESIEGLDLDVREGEIVGIAGLDGSGRERVARMLFGAIARAGHVRVRGAKDAVAAPAQAMQEGMALVPADRRTEGLFAAMTVRENLMVPHLPGFRKALGRINVAAERRTTAEWLNRVDVRPRDTERPVWQLSGGNQQKIVLARCLALGPSVLVLDEPTQGVDIGAKGAIYTLIAEAAASGTAVVVCSSDNEELAEICDRVVVLRDGRTDGEVCGEELTEERLVQATLGGCRRPQENRV